MLAPDCPFYVDYFSGTIPRTLVDALDPERISYSRIHNIAIRYTES